MVIAQLLKLKIFDPLIRFNAANKEEGTKEIFDGDTMNLISKYYEDEMKQFDEIKELQII